MANTKIPVELSSTPGIVDNSNATAITIDSSENVTLAANLEVSGADVTITSNIIHAGDGNTYFGFNDADTFRIVTGGSEALRVNSSQNVGIGITSPSKPLHIYSASDTAIRLQNSTTGTGTTDGFLLEQSGLDSLIVNYEAGNLRFSTSNSERMRIDSSGNVGIGTSGAEKRLHITDSTQANQTIRFGNPSATPYGEINYDSSGFEHLYISSKGTTTGYGNIVFNTGSTPSEAMRIDSSGNVQIGGVSHQNLSGSALELTIGTTGDTVNDGGGISFTHNNTLGSYILGQKGELQIAHYTSGSPITFRTNNAGSNGERMRITSDGKVAIAETSPSFKLEVIGNAGTDGSVCGLKDAGNAGSNRDYIRFYNASSAIAGRIEHTSSTGVTYVTSSDYRLKENVRPIENGIDRVKKLNPVKFDWKEDGTSNEGFIAHEVQEIFPDAIAGEKDGEEMQGMDYGRITPLLVKAIQEQQAQIEALQSEINELKNS